MMRPMKLAGSQLMFGEGCLDFIKTIETKKTTIVVGGSSMKKSGTLDKVIDLFKSINTKVDVVSDVEPDPSFATVKRGAKQMIEFGPDLIVALGGGSTMDAAKAMWIYYEHPELKELSDIMPPKVFPKLRNKARMLCIPSTSGSASEVSRSIVITENGMKYGLGNMEMMPDIAICDPTVTMSMPKHITADTGLDALTHALEALASNRANYISDILATQAVKDVFEYLPQAVEDGTNMKAREMMVNASMGAGLAFTNVSLGIVHSMAHTLGSYFHVPHGLADAVILPTVIRFNSQNEVAKSVYEKMAKQLDPKKDLPTLIEELNAKVNVPLTFETIIEDKKKYLGMLDELSSCAIADGCTKTNPIFPTKDEMKELFKKVLGV